MKKENSFTEENYLKAIYKLSSGGKKAVYTNDIALSLNTKAASVTDMMRKLSKKKYILYKKYYGVTLSDAGKKVALAVIRKHRLWEHFLVEKLKFKWDEVHFIAEQLEHIRSEELIEKLDSFLNHPRFDPHGDPIPDPNGRMQIQETVPLSLLKKKGRCIMMGVIDHSPEFLRHLEKLNLTLGNEITIHEITSYDGSMKISAGDHPELFISRHIADNILVSVR
jgi:DtxR family Mn-dependent transcriptional regulator